MGINVIGLLLSGIVFFTYSATCLISLFFALSIDLYRKIEEKANLEIFSNPIINPLLENNIGVLNLWMEKHHKIIGSILIFFSIMDMHLLFKIINAI